MADGLSILVFNVLWSHVKTKDETYVHVVSLLRITFEYIYMDHQRLIIPYALFSLAYVKTQGRLCTQKPSVGLASPEEKLIIIPMTLQLQYCLH